MEYNGLKLVKLTFACPEQYYVYKGSEKVGFLHLRYGYFYAEAYSTKVYEATVKGDGLFQSDEREYHLLNALKAIDEFLNS